MKDKKGITHNDIIAAANVLVGNVIKTPVSHSRSFSARLGYDVFLKKENEQRTGSFKIRGAFNKIHSLTADERSRGVVACSAGNHAQGVALSARLAGVKAHIVMPTNASLVKIEATREYGAEVILHGDFYDQAADYAKLLATEKGFTFIHPYEDSKIIAGQGTIGLEIITELQDCDAIIVPIGGGGLISGIATAVKAMRPSCKIYGVQTARVPSMVRAFREGKFDIVADAGVTIADGIAVKRPSQMMFETYISNLVDDVTTVTEDEIADALVQLMERAKTVAEGSGAVSLAAMLQKKFPLKGKVVPIISGGNIDINIISKVIDLGLTRAGRLTQLSVIVADVPGMLSKITLLLGQEKANVLQVSHDRANPGLHLLETKIDFLLETHSKEHADRVKAALEKAGIHLM